MIFFACLAVSMALIRTGQSLGPSNPVIFKLKLPDYVRKTYDNMKEELPSTEAAKVEETFKNLDTTVGKINKNLDQVQKQLYAIFGIVAEILSKGTTFQTSFQYFEGVFAKKPANLITMKDQVEKIKECAPRMKVIVDTFIAAGFDTDQIKQTSSSLNDLITTELDDMAKTLEELPDNSKAIAAGETMPDDQKPKPWETQQG